MRIGIVHPAFLNRGGAENLTLWLASGLARRGHSVTLFAAGLVLDRWEDIDLATVRTVELPDRRDSLWHEPARSRHHGRIIARHSADADLLVCGIHPSHLWLSSALALMSQPPASLLYCQEPRRKYYYMWTDWPTVAYVESGRRTLPFHEELAHGVRYRRRASRLSKAPLARWYDRRKLARLDSIVANSRFTAGNASRVWRRHVEVCYPGVPAPEASTAPTGADRTGVVVLTGWGAAKNPMGVLGAIDHLVHQLGRRDIRFTISGGGLIPQYQQYIREHGLADVIDVRGFVTEDEKDHLLRCARLCLFVPLAEPFGLVAAEALIRGTPVVASDHGGPAEVVEHGVSGALVDPYDPPAIAQAVARLYDDDAWESMSRAAVLRAREVFSMDAFLDRFEAHAAGVAQQRGTAEPHD